MNSTLKTYSTLASYPNFTAGHTLQPNGACSCGQWSLTGSSEASLIRSHQIHTQQVQRPLVLTHPDPSIATFPDTYATMRDAFVRQALQHPHWAGMTNDQVCRSVENKLWSIIQRRAKGNHPLKPGDYIDGTTAA